MISENEREAFLCGCKIQKILDLLAKQSETDDSVPHYTKTELDSLIFLPQAKFIRLYRATKKEISLARFEGAFFIQNALKWLARGFQDGKWINPDGVEESRNELLFRTFDLYGFLELDENADEVILDLGEV